jgi:Predicted sugar kinase
MGHREENKIVVVKRNTRLEDLVGRFNTVSQAKFYIEHLGADFSDYLKEDEIYKQAIAQAQMILGAFGRVQVVNRPFLPNFIFGPGDLVVVVGQDGLVANTMKYLDAQLLIGVNPDPGRWDGVLLPFMTDDLKRVVPEIIGNHRPVKEVTMAKAQLNDGQVLYAVNDLFIGQRTHVSARYLLELGPQKEQQSSSGIIISTGLGSTAWLRSVLVGAVSIVKSISGQKSSGFQPPAIQLSWDADYLFYSVREPFPSKISKADLVFGKVTPKMPLKIRSLMPDNGVIFSDGIENDFLSFNSGVEATITVAEKKGRLVI